MNSTRRLSMNSWIRLHTLTSPLRYVGFIYFCVFLVAVSAIRNYFTLKTVQGEVEFRSVLYIPGMGPLNNEDVVNPKTKNIRLYVKRVFISDDFDGELVSFNILT